MEQQKKLSILLCLDVETALLVEIALTKHYRVSIHGIYGNNPEMIAEQLIKKMKFDLFITGTSFNRRYPDISGMDFIKKIKSGAMGAKNQSIKSLIITAHALTGDKEKILATGVDSCLTKPFSTKELISEIKRLFPEINPDLKS